MAPVDPADAAWEEAAAVALAEADDAGSEPDDWRGSEYAGRIADSMRRSLAARPDEPPATAEDLARALCADKHGPDDFDNPEAACRGNHRRKAKRLLDRLRTPDAPADGGGLSLERLTLALYHCGWPDIDTKAVAAEYLRLTPSVLTDSADAGETAT